MIPKPSFCQQCPINRYTGTGYTPLVVRPGTALMVGEASGEDEVQSGQGFSGGSGRWLWNMAAMAGMPRESCSTLNVIGCHPPGNTFPGSPEWHHTSREVALEGVRYCTEHHMWPGVRRAGKKKIYAVGGQALGALTGRTGITTWRGSLLPLRGSSSPSVMPIIHPAALMRQAKFTSVTVGDLRKPHRLPPENYNLAPTLIDVQRWRAKSFAFDFEWDAKGITLCGLSDRFYGAVVVPFREPFLGELQRIFEEAEVLIGHNIIGADLAWIEQMGWKLRARIEDTMLKQHLVQPDYPHGLDFVASVFTSKVFWKGKGWDEMDEESEGDATPGQQWRTWDRGDALPRELGGYGGCTSAREAFALYNARDTDAEFQINTPLQGLLHKWDLNSLYTNVSRPAAYICRWIGDRGLRLDTSRLAGIRAGIDVEVAALESKLPEGLAPYTKEVGCNIPAPEGTYRAKTRICKGPKGSRHEGVGIVFVNPQNQSCPTCEQSISSGAMSLAKVLKGTKIEKVVPYNSPPAVAAYAKNLKLREIIDRKSGNATTGKAARGQWAKSHPEFALLGRLKQQITLRNNFAKDSLLGLDRMFFNLKVHGTNEGRLSCSGRRRGIDLNIQNQPSEFRGIYIPEKEGWGFLNGDISQGESWLTCWLAEDWVRWEKLQTPGYDEHSELASAQFGKTVTKAHTTDKFWATLHPDWTSQACHSEALAWDALRQVGKKTNHASSYGMGYRTYHQQLVTAGFSEYTEGDAKYFLEQWRVLNPGTVAWQERTRQEAEKQGYLRNPFGRVRWFSSRDAGTQCLAFLPASTLADMVLRMLIAHYPSHFQAELDAEGVGVYHDLAPEWIVSAQVHDSLVMQGPWDHIETQQERSHMIFTQAWKQLGGFAFKADWKRSMVSWGDCH